MIPCQCDIPMAAFSEVCSRCRRIVVSVNGRTKYAKEPKVFEEVTVKKATGPVAYTTYVAKASNVRARQLTDNEVVECYNGTKIGTKGDFVVVDEYDRVMIMRSDRFRNAYEEPTSEKA